jgi:hypothetical protein
MARRPGLRLLLQGVLVRPNIPMICANQFRAEFVSTDGENPSARTPTIDVLTRRERTIKPVLQYA